MKAVILAGGMGVRLRPFTFSIPKPLLPIGEKPILEVIINRLKKFGFGDFVLAIGYKSKMVQAYFGDGSEFGVRIKYLVEKKPSGTAGPLAQLRKKFRLKKEESVLLMNGDILTKLNFAKMIACHRKNSLEITVGIKDVRGQNAYGVVNIKNGMVKNVTEKPFTTHTVSTGIYIINASAIKEVPEGGFFTMPRLINRLVSAGRRVGAYHVKEFWRGMEEIQHFEDIHSNKHFLNKLIEI